MKTIIRIIVLTIFLLSGCSSTDHDPGTPVTLVNLDIEPKISVLDIGTSEYYKAVATYSDGTVTEVSDQVSWSLENNSGIIVPKNDPDYPGLTFAEAVQVGTDNLIAALESMTTTASVTVVDVVLVSLAISPSETSVPIGSEVTFAAEGTYSDGHTQDLTEESAWSSSNTAAVSNPDMGVANAVGEGVASITASFDSATSNSANVAVHDPKEIILIEVSPIFSQLFVDGEQLFSARAHYSDGSIDLIPNSSLLWISSDTTVAAQDIYRKGLFRAQSVGSAIITADYGIRYQGTALITVDEAVLEGIVVTPRDASLAVGEQRSYFTEALVSDGSQRSINQSANQSYSVGDPSIAYISNLPENKGQLQGLKTGTTSVISTFVYEGQTYTDQATVTVTP